MIKAIRKMMNKPVFLNLLDREYNNIEEIGGGIRRKEPGTVLILRGLDSHWLVVEWQYNSQVVVIPAADVVCIAKDIV